MSRETFSYTPGEGDKGYRDRSAPGWYHDDDASRAASTVEAQTRYQRAMTWEAPTGHAGWCVTQTPPEMRAGHSVYGPQGRTPMASPGCSCGKSATARHLRKLAAMGAIVTGDSAPILKGVAA